MAINNFDLIEKYLNFSDKDKFYFIQILQRKKDNPEIESSKGKVVKSYYVDNLEYLHEKKDEIIKLCKMFNARAGIRLNRRSYEQSAFRLLSRIASKLESKDFIMNRVYDSVLGSNHSETNKTWLIDLDGHDINIKETIEEVINYLDPKGDKIVGKIPSKNGLHLITKPFNLIDFQEYFGNIDIHKDSPTNLYIP